MNVTSSNKEVCIFGRMYEPIQLGLRGNKGEIYCVPMKYVNYVKKSEIEKGNFLFKDNRFTSEVERIEVVNRVKEIVNEGKMDVFDINKGKFLEEEYMKWGGYETIRELIERNKID